MRFGVIPEKNLPWWENRQQTTRGELNLMSSEGASEADEAGKTVVNITGYKFVDLPDAATLRGVFRARCQNLGLKGLILLSTEGMNYFLAGSCDATSSFRNWIEEVVPDSSSALKGRFKAIPCKVCHTEETSLHACFLLVSPSICVWFPLRQGRSFLVTN